MDTAQAKRTIVGSLLATGGLAAARDLSDGRIPRMRIFLGVLGVGIVLAAGADAAPALVGAFALLMLTTAVFLSGPTIPVLGRILK